MTIFAPILTGPQVADAARSVLDRWLVVYIAELERQLDLAPRTISPPKSVRTFADNDEITKRPEQATPAVVIMAPGITERPERDGDSSYRAVWGLAVGAVVSARGNQEAAEVLAARYAAAIRACLIQHRTLEGFATGVDWVTESYDELPSQASRTLAACRVVFEVEVRDVVTSSAGPTGEPPDDPYAEYEDWPEATSHDVSIDRVASTTP